MCLYWLHVRFWLYCMLVQFYSTIIWKLLTEPLVQILCYGSEGDSHTKCFVWEPFITFLELEQLSAGQSTEAAVHFPAQTHSAQVLSWLISCRFENHCWFSLAVSALIREISSWFMRNTKRSPAIWTNKRHTQYRNTWRGFHNISIDTKE